MKKYLYKIIISFLFLFLIINPSFSQIQDNEIIANVNGENIYLNTFNRLFNARQKKLPIEKNQENAVKEKILNQIIEDTLILQEAKARNLEANEEEINKRFNLTTEKQGGEEAFKKFLAENNATIEDAKDEIKKQILYDQIKEDIIKGAGNLSTFINNKKQVASIVIYKDKVFPQELTSETNITIRASEYPAITKEKVESQVKEIKKLEEQTKEAITIDELTTEIKEFRKKIEERND
ncbi:MAG: SurA N-terminal domain-containing protein [Candidatus Melainabacteria bacterium]|nr:SurA N-terminal domain-containing protein [Candidatus Melainabacteria bacterium]